jgi:class 3 adenylate cyclase/tetratricopeptide (TPR) repeat protein
MGCPSCGSENSAAAKFCEECGTRLPRRCPSCGHEVGATAKFCLECGERLGGASPSAATPSELPSPRSYTPPHLAERIDASRAALEGERKQVTVLFADVVGSTELIQDRDPEEAQRLLDGIVQIMMDAIHRYEGTVSRLMGDGLMAMFGAPVAHEDHAVRACYAALAMQEAVRRHLPELLRAHGAEVEIRVGLNSGEVVVRLVRDDLHMDYTAMGQTVNLASRLEQLARGGSVRLSAETLALVEGYVQVRSLGPVPIRGLPEPVEIFELLGVGLARTRLQVAAARGLTRFVGRQAELEALYGALDRAGAGHGQVAALVGEPGVGKSRLVWELTHSHRTQGWTVLESGSVSYGKATSYLPVIDLLKGYCRIEARDDERAIREKVTGKLLTLDEGLRSALPALLALLDVPPGDVVWDSLNPSQRRRQTFDAVRRLLLCESQEQPLLLVFEDLHWIDSETQALLDGLVDSLPTARILLLVNYRPEYRHEWGNRGYYTQLRIDPLGEAGADELLAGLLGNDASLEPLKALLLARTEGNPLFLEESVRSLVETGALAGERGAYHLPIPLAGIRVPATVQAVLGARIDRLPPEEKRLLQIAAVIGKDVPDALLRIIADREEEGLRRGLAALQAAEFLYEASLFPELEYTFKHALTHEVAYGSLLQERRRMLHARIVDTIERLYADRLVEHVERLAYHALRGDAWAKGVAYCRQAGVRAVARSANREAVDHFEQALAALRSLPERPDTLEQAIDLRLDVRQALVPLGDFRTILEHLREAETIAEALGDQRRLGRILSWMSYSYFFTLGDHDRAIETGQRALTIGRALEDVPLQVVTAFYLAYPHHQRGNYRPAIEALRSVVATLQGDLVHERFGMAAYPSVLSHALLAWCLGDVGAFAEGRTYADEAIRLAELVDQPWSQGVASSYLGYLYVGQGDLGTAIPLLEQCRALVERWDFVRLDSFVSSLLGTAYALDGRHADSLPLLDRATAMFGSEEGGSETRLAIPLIEGYLLVGRVEDARRIAERALDAARRRKERVYQAQALRLLGDIVLRSHPPDVVTAEAHYREALALAEELGMRPLQARCHLGLGKLYRRTGRSDDARAELATAVEMLREMGMAFWLPEAEGELAEATR